MIQTKLENPWNINSLYELQFFNCPSCEYKHDSKQDFVFHAYESHPDSVYYLTNVKDGSLKGILYPWDCEVKLEPISEIDKLNEEQSKDSYSYQVNKIDYENEEILDDMEVGETNKNANVLAQMVKCYYCAKEMDRSVVRTHMEKFHTLKPVIFNILKKESTIFQIETTTTENFDDNSVNVKVKLDDLPKLTTKLNKDIVQKNTTRNEDQKDSKSCDETLDHHTEGNVSGDEIYLPKENDNTEQLVMCYYCNIAFEYSEIRKHIETQHATEEVIFTPVESVKLVQEERENITHTRTTHEDMSPIRNYKCDVCVKAFTTSSKLKMHKDIKHEGKKDWICSECGKAFAHKPVLKRHFIRDHEGKKMPEETYICAKCSISVLKSSLKDHI